MIIRAIYGCGCESEVDVDNEALALYERQTAPTRICNQCTEDWDMALKRIKDRMVKSTQSIIVQSASDYWLEHQNDDSLGQAVVISPGIGGFLN